tara:strand:+ start:1105 stop:1758 length:654 start_codon:yes stop_codon:yes gene_type:complete
MRAPPSGGVSLYFFIEVNMTTPTTQLQAVNSMLSTIGEAPVNSLSSGLVDAETAETVLNEVSRDVQSFGWNFNSEPDVIRGKDTDGRVELTDNTLRADLASSVNKYRSNKNEYVQRGLYMYDKVQHTYNINKELKLDIVYMLDFTLIPEVARRYITIKAARLFQERVVGSDNLSAMNRADEQQALFALKEMESENGDYNIFDDGGTYSVLDRSIGHR